MVSDNHLTKPSWTYVWNCFTTETRLHYLVAMLKNKWRPLRKQYMEAKWLRGSMAGLGWDYVRGTVIADDEWWAAHIQQNAATTMLRGKRLPNILDMERMVGGFQDLSSFGWFAQMRKAHSIPNMDEAAVVDVGEEIGDTFTRGNTCSSILSSAV